MRQTIRIFGIALVLLTGSCSTASPLEPAFTPEGSLQQFRPLQETNQFDAIALGDSPYLGGPVVSPIGELPGGERLYLMTGVIIDPLDENRGEPGECIVLVVDDGAKSSCRAQSAADPWPIWERLVGSGYVGWAGLDTEVAWVELLEDGVPLGAQRPLDGITTLRVGSPAGSVTAILYDQDGGRLGELVVAEAP